MQHHPSHFVLAIVAGEVVGQVKDFHVIPVRALEHFHTDL